MDEFALINRFFANRGPTRSDVVLGIGDDAAVTRVDGRSELVIATDTLVEGTHFLPGMAPRDLGFRCLAVNLSDLAAMGAEPQWCTLSLAMLNGDEHWVANFADGFMELAHRFGIALIGGDTVRGPLSITVTVHGRVEPGKAILRTGAGVGDSIYVTGSPGAAGAGLSLLRSNEEGPALTERFLRPFPRVAEGRSLIGIASAMIDVSDGLHVDLARLLAGSGVGATLEVASLPLSDDLLHRFDARRAIEFALTGGDDYELCFTVPSEQVAVLNRIAGTWGCELTRIGTVHGETGLVWRESGRDYSVPDSGFRHFGEDVR